MILRKKSILVMLVLLTFACLCGCGNGKKEEFASLKQTLETETPYLAQDELEKQLVERMNEYFYFDGGTAYERPLLAYKGVTFDYIAMHHKAKDEDKAYNYLHGEDAYTAYYASVIMQPRDESMKTLSVGLAVYNDSVYEFLRGTSPQKRMEFTMEELADIQAEATENMFCEEDAKIWYTGTITVGEGDKPEYPDFDEKEEKITEVREWTMDWLKGCEIAEEDVVVYIRDFREDDGSTDILIEDASGDTTCMMLTYYFYGANDFQKIFEFDGSKYRTYVERLEETAVNK